MAKIEKFIFDTLRLQIAAFELNKKSFECVSMQSDILKLKLYPSQIII